MGSEQINVPFRAGPVTSTLGTQEGAMPKLKRFEPIAFLLLLAALGYAFSGAIPGSELHEVSQVEILAVYAAVSAVAALLMLRFLPVRRFALERFVYAAFLGAMPLVYLSAALLQHAGSSVAVELKGVGVNKWKFTPTPFLFCRRFAS